MAAMNEKQERTWAMLCHLGAFAGFIVPFGHIIAPLVIWLVKKEESPLVNEQGKESLNFQISMTIYGIVAAILTLILVGIFLAIGLLILDIVMVIVAALKANKGEHYRYPITIRMIK
jgi:hypothetical protein